MTGLEVVVDEVEGNESSLSALILSEVVKTNLGFLKYYLICHIMLLY